MTGKWLPLRVWLCVYFVNIKFIAFAGAPLRWCVKCVNAFIFSEGAITNDNDDSTSTSSLAAPKMGERKKKRNTILSREKKLSTVTYVEYGDESIIIFCSRRVFCLRFMRFTEKNVGWRHALASVKWVAWDWTHANIAHRRRRRIHYLQINFSLLVSLFIYD